MKMVGGTSATVLSVGCAVKTDLSSAPEEEDRGKRSTDKSENQLSLWPGGALSQPVHSGRRHSGTRLKTKTGSPSTL